MFNRWNKFNRFLLKIGGVLLAGSLFLAAYRWNPWMQQGADEVYGFFSSVRYTLIDEPLKTFTTMVSDFATLYQLRDENRRLRLQIDLLAQFQARLEEAYRDIDDLKTLNDLKLAMTDFEVIASTVINRPYGTYTHSLTLDVGSQDGIEIGDAVINAGGLIGKVVSVQSQTCEVLLLTTEQTINKVSVKIQLTLTTTADALLEYYDPNRGAYVLTLLNSTSSITDNMTVITSGLGLTYPSGVLVGWIDGTEYEAGSSGIQVLARPAADFTQLNYVLVIKRGR
jgi:rod shape-determining protein MreC